MNQPLAESSDVCPRCAAAFHCGVTDATPCACTTVRLDAATLRALREQYGRCLCLRCLIEVQTEVQAEGSTGPV